MFDSHKETENYVNIDTICSEFQMIHNNKNKNYVWTKENICILQLARTIDIYEQYFYERNQ